MLIKTAFRSNKDNREILPENETGLPYICLLTDPSNFIHGEFPWHWHSDFEADYVEEGEVELRTKDTTLHLRKGDAVFVNSGVMHAFRLIPGKSCRVYAHIFEASFLSGLHNSILEKKYVFPILKSSRLQTYPILPNTRENVEMIGRLVRIAELVKEEPFGYEFEIRGEISRFWCLLLKATEEVRAGNTVMNTADTERIKSMIQYIHDNYGKKLTLQDIAGAANISSRECSRCFRRCIHDSPINYLNTYRVRMAALMLLQSGESVMTIGENCGFSSSSYFGKIFYETMGCTPSAYRREMA